MIPVTLAPVPRTFDAKVRQPGLSAIDEMVGRPPRKKHSGPQRKKIADNEGDIPPDAFPPYWRDVLPEMRAAYESRCAYLAMHIHHATGNATVDHVLPKSTSWNQVYEWSNYRLCAGIINSKKGALLTLVDPCEIRDDWFALNMKTLFVEVGIGAPGPEMPRIEATLPTLNLRPCVQEREEYVHRYRLGPGAHGIDLAYLEDYAPFIAREMRRQGHLLRGDV